MAERAASDWPWPWPHPANWRDDAGPAEEVTFEVKGITFRVTPTEFTGVTSGRRRYEVLCESCKSQLHPATTGPASRCRGHLTRGCGTDD